MQTQRLLDFLKKNRWEWALFAVILLTGIFFRTYHFSEWLHFEVDQVYDVFSVAPAMEDISKLPLLGPVAAGGPLRLGPAFYYLQYLSAKIAGNTPTGHAGAVWFFSIAALPMFYLFARRYFSGTISLMLFGLFSVSFYLVLYSRFSWNPNILPFFVLATFYALLRVVSESEKRPKVWFVVFCAALGITLQLHFNALLIVGPVAGVFLLLKRPKLYWRAWLAGAVVVLLLYLPIIVHDMYADGKNTKHFFAKVTGEKEAEDERQASLAERAFQVARYDAYEYFLILTGIDQVNDSRPRGFSLGLDCKTCGDELPFRLAALVLFFLEIGVLVWVCLKEKDREKKDFAQLLVIWFLGSSLYFLAVMYGDLYLYPRFFLVVAPVPFFLLGLVAEKVLAVRRRFGMMAVGAVAVVIAGMNMKQTNTYFHQLDATMREPIEVETEDVLPNFARVTLEQQQAIVDFMEAKYQENGLPVYLRSESEYELPLWYHLKQRGITRFDQIRSDEFYGEGNYFAVVQTATEPDKAMRKILKAYDFREVKDFGSLTVYYAQVAPDGQSAEHDFSRIQKKFQPEKASALRTWGNVFSSEK
jgi:hypothetical protein